MESELPSSPSDGALGRWMGWDAVQEADTGIPCTPFTGKQRVPIFGTVMPAIAHSGSAAPPIPVWIGQQISWEVNFLSQLCLQEFCSFGMNVQSECKAA